jgi:hypothetical protein
MINDKLTEEQRMSWVRLFNELTYAGFKKRKIYSTLDERFGSDNWSPAHFFDGEVVSRATANRIYGQSYYEFLRGNPSLRQDLIENASEVFDIAPSNIQSGYDYEKQECEATHLQDIAVRRALARIRLEEQGINYDEESLPRMDLFKGDHLVQIRDHTTEGFYRFNLNPGQVPFHKPELILDTEQRGWWTSGSVEDWYQKNKVLLIRPESFLVRLAILSTDGQYFESDRNNYYLRKVKEDRPEFRHLEGRKARAFLSQGKSSGYKEVRNSPTQDYLSWKEFLDSTNLDVVTERGRVNFGELK